MAEAEATICSVEECDKPTHGRGFCRPHYMRWWRYGDPLAGRKARVPGKTWQERIHHYYIVDTDTGCWMWTGAINHHGYGMFNVPEGLRRAHRVMYELMVGPIPEGEEIDHTCHTDDPTCWGGATCPHRRCCNPEHLEAVTPRENQLRGNGVGGMNARKTHCPQGHPYDEENTFIVRGSRRCRICQEARNRARYV